MYMLRTEFANEKARIEELKKRNKRQKERLTSVEIQCKVIDMVNMTNPAFTEEVQNAFCENLVKQVK
jgi:hypothetical protein